MSDGMKYMIMTFGDASTLAARSREWVEEMISFMKRIDVEERGSGTHRSGDGLGRESGPRRGAVIFAARRRKPNPIGRSDRGSVGCPVRLAANPGPNRENAGDTARGRRPRIGSGLGDEVDACLRSRPTDFGEGGGHRNVGAVGISDQRRRP